MAMDKENLFSVIKENRNVVLSPSKKRKRGIFSLRRFRTESERKTKNGNKSSSDEEQVDDLVTFEEFLGLEVNNRDHLEKQRKRRKKMRSNVIQEIMNTEQSYIDALEDILQGYRDPMTRNENFTSEQIDRIFGNLDEILSFQRYFYNKLESVYHHENPSLSSFGKIFAQNCPSFKVYSKYCVNFNSAVNELTRLESLSTFADFFEECRVSRGLQQLKLADFLLQPIQRICKYPLHLTELQKHTEVYHTDCRSVNQALKDMKKMTHEINSERKSAEAKNSISEWQKDVSNWIGKDVNVKSKSILYTGKLSKCENFEDLDQIRWVTLFELQLIICKKASSADEKQQFDERIDLNHCLVNFSQVELSIDFECHFKKYTRKVKVFAKNLEEFEIWRSKILYETQFANIEEDCEHLIIPSGQAKIRIKDDKKNSLQRNIVRSYIFDGMRKKKNCEQYKTL